MGVKDTDIAIIGISCRFPKSKNVEEFWSNLENSVDCISSFSDRELIASGIEKNTIQNSNYIKRNGFLDDVDLFDAQFFDIPPMEARSMDPQHRLFLECAWEALESSAYNSFDYEGLIGVFASCGINRYLFEHILKNDDSRLDPYTLMILNDKDALATKLAYKLNLRGPAITVQTACSSSLVSIHYASQSLLNGECNIALAGGVSISSFTKEGYTYRDGMILSPDGFCRAFDEKATGTVGGNGVGIVVLKIAEYAIEDRDFIYAIIKGSAVNNDGKNKVGYTAPSIEGQKKAILEAWENAEIEVEKIDYIEAHGTGTKLGDPIEIEALTLAMREYTREKQFCAIGSVKTNIGHTDAAAGCAGLIKATLSLHYKKIPPSLHCSKPNSRINFAQSPFFVNTQLLDISSRKKRCTMGVSSFGIGGTNAHVVLEENTYTTANQEIEQWNLLLFSAKTSQSLNKMTENFVSHLAENAVNISDAAYTLQLGREVFDYRRMVVCEGKEDAEKILQQHDSSRIFDRHQKTKNHPIIFSFNGKVSYWIGKTKELYETHVVFRKNIDLCSELLNEKLDLIDILYSQEHKHKDFAELSAFVVEYCFAKLWLSWGVCPESMIAKGTGEYAAACIAGVFSLKDALLFICDEPTEHINLNSPEIPFLSYNTHEWVTVKQTTDLSYWTSIKQKICFSEESEILLQMSGKVILSMGNGEELHNLVRDSHKKIEIFSSICKEESKSETQFLTTTLGKIWLHGVYINWEVFYKGKKRHRLPLPTYPFAHKRYWFEKPKKTYPTLAIEKESDIRDWFYVPSWKKLPLIEKEQKNTFLIFTNENQLSLQLIEKLRKQGKQICEVKIGERFQKQGQTYFVNPGKPEDYCDLVENLQKKRVLPERVVHLWNLSQDSYLTLDLIDTAQNLGLYSLIYFVQALGKFHVTNNVDIAVVSNGIHSVTEDETLYPEKSTLLGAIKVIPLEYPNIRCCNIDIVLPEVPAIDQLVEKILNEVTSDFSEIIVALRGKNRWCSCYEPIRLKRPSTDDLLIKDGGVYLILGGLGRMGLTIAKYLAETAKKTKLILVSRSQFPDRNNWSSHIKKHGKENTISRKITKIRALEKNGAEISVFSIDITNLPCMKSVLDEVRTKFSKINGVVHSAGAIDYYGIIQKRVKKTIDYLLAPKVRGLLILEKLLPINQLDFMILFSSLGNVLYKTQFAQVGCNSANEFMDAFSQYQQMRNSNVIAINWEQDMTSMVKKHLLTEENNKNIKPCEGVEVFAICLKALLPRLVISTVNLQAKNKFLQTTIGDLSKREIDFQPRPDLPTPYTPPRDEIEQSMIDIWEKLLGIKGVGIQDSFFDLGGDSLLAIQIVDEVNRVLVENLGAHTLLENPTINDICTFLKKSLGEKPETSLLVHLQKVETSKTPLFLIHPVGGHVYFYRDLVEHLGKNQPVYGINAVGLDQKEKPLNDVKKIAQRYIQEIQMVQAQGPYFLGGSSFGGIVAFEIAQQLLSINQKVSLLVMIDTPGPGKMPKDLSFNNDKSKLIEFLTNYKNQMYENMDIQRFQHLIHLFNTHTQAMRNYSPLPYPNKIIFFSAEEENEYLPPNLEESWFDLAEGGVEVHKVPGNHITMNSRKNVTSIAQILKSYLIQS